MNPMDSSVSDTMIANFDRWVINEVDQAEEKNQDPTTKLMMYNNPISKRADTRPRLQLWHIHDAIDGSNIF